MLNNRINAHDKAVPSRAGLLAWQSFIRADSHILRRNPGLLFQQAANQPDSAAPARQAAARLAAGRVASPWLRWMNKPQSPDPCLLTVGGEEGRVSCGAFLSGGTKVLAASGPELQVWDFESGVQQSRIPLIDDDISRCFRAPGGETAVFVGSRGLIVFDCVRLSELFRMPEEAVSGRWLFSADGRRAACVLRDPARVMLWDLDRRRLVLERAGETDPRRPVVFCAGGRRAVVHWRAGLELLDSTAGSLVAGLDGDAPAAEGQLVVSVSEGKTITLWDAMTGERLWAIPAGRSVYRCSIAPGAKRILADVIMDEVLDQVVWGHLLYDTESGNLVANLTSGYGASVSAFLEKQVGTVEPVSLPGHAFWPDGNRLATWPPFATHIKVWGTGRGEKLSDLAPHPAWIQSCELSSTGGHLAAACQDGSLVVWNGRDLSRCGTLRGNARQILDCFYSPEGLHLATVTEDGILKIWEIPAAADSEASAHQGRVTACAFSASGDKLLSAALDGVLMLRDPDSGEATGRLNPGGGGIPAAALPPAGDNVAFISGQPYATVYIWNTKTGAVASLGDIGHAERGGRCRFSPDGRHLVAIGGSRHGIGILTSKVSIWRTDTWLEVFSRDYGVPMAHFDLTPDGRWAVFNLKDGTLLVWDFRGGPGAEMKETKSVQAFALHPSSQWVLLTRSDSRAQVMQLETQAALGTQLSVGSMANWRAFSRDGMSVASWPCTVARIDPRSFSLELAWEAASEYFLSFSADGEYVTTCAGTEAIVLRRADDGGLISKFYPRGAFNQIDFAPGGRRLAVGTMLGEVHLLKLEGETEKGGLGLGDAPLAGGGRGDPWPGASRKIPLGRGARGRPPGLASGVSSGGSVRRTGLNDPCPCGSGKKYKKCCGAAR